MKKDTMISIVMPAYNAEKYLKEAISSVQAQTWKEWELIIIDDNSHDKTSEIAREYEALDSRIRYIKNTENLGASESRNKGIQAANGQWIAFLDSDDRWAPKKLELQLKFAQKNHAQFTFTGSVFIDEEGNPLSYYLSAPSQISYRQLLKQNVISCSSILIDRNLLLPYPMPTGELHENFAAWLKILKTTGIKACGLDQPLLIYRVSARSKSGNKWKAAKMTYRVYRYIGLTPLESTYYWGWYAFRSFRKYKGIYKNSISR